MTPIYIRIEPSVIDVADPHPVTPIPAGASLHHVTVDNLGRVHTDYYQADVITVYSHRNPKESNAE